MKRILFIASIASLLITTSCHKNIYKRTDCTTYYQFILDNWKQHRKSTHFLKGNPEYWKGSNTEKYFKKECLLGLKKSEILTLFGTPKKVYVDNANHKRYFIYCLGTDSTNCSYAYHGNHNKESFVLIFDKSYEVTGIKINPPF